MLSPFVVYFMARAKGCTAILAPIAICAVCLAFRCWLVAKNCPDIMAGKMSAGCEGTFQLEVYVQTWTRMSPYGFGMYAAYLHLKDDDHSFINRAPVIIEWLAFLIFFIIPFNA
jgi:hypothetical protein